MNTATPPRVMLVDDEECIRETVMELLASENIPAIAASCAEECLQLLHDGFRGVILMDVMMPGRDGWSTIRAMADEQLLAGNIIAMLTAMDVPDSNMDGLQEVIIDYIVKPFEALPFLDAIQKYLSLLDQQNGAL